MVTCVFVGVLLFAYLAWFAPKKSPAAILPSPNGYSNLLSAGTKVPPATGNYRDWSHDELAAFVRTNAAILDEARLGLSRPCQVPIEYSRDYFSRHLPELSAIKSLAFFFSATGRLAELEHRPADAEQSYLDSIRLGQESARGGVLIDLLVGTACEDMGLTKLERLVDQLDPKSAQHAIRTLGELETNRPPIQDAISREQEWERRAATFRERVVSIWTSKSLNPSRKNIQRAIPRLNATIRKHRVLMLQLAARVYEVEHGSKPARAEQLVPDLLRSIPKDPETGTNLTLPTPSR